jgi:excisionase family DNA binding protein
VKATEPLLISKRTAATLLGISIGTLDRLVRQGKLRAIRIGRRVLFKRASLENFTGADFSVAFEGNSDRVM